MSVRLKSFSPVGGPLCVLIGHLTKNHSRIAFRPALRSFCGYLFYCTVHLFIVQRISQQRSFLPLLYLCFGIQNPSIEHILTRCGAFVKRSSSPFSPLPKTQTMDVNHFCSIKYIRNSTWSPCLV